MEFAKAVESVGRNFLTDWQLSRDQEGLSTLQSWHSKHNNLKRLVDADLLAQRNGGKKAKYILTILEQVA